MIKTSDEIRKEIRKAFDVDRGFFDEKFYKTRALKDSAFYAPSVEALLTDFALCRKATAERFDIPVDMVKHLATNPSTIWDCDNMARELRHGLNFLHFQRYRHSEHHIPAEYAAFQITGQFSGPFSVDIHDFVMIFTEEQIYFACLMLDDVWTYPKRLFKLLGIGG